MFSFWKGGHLMWSQIETTSKLKDNKYRSKKYLPYVFTEQGIAMFI